MSTPEPIILGDASLNPLAIFTSNSHRSDTVIVVNPYSLHFHSINCYGELPHETKDIDHKEFTSDQLAYHLHSTPLHHPRIQWAKMTSHEIMLLCVSADRHVLCFIELATLQLLSQHEVDVKQANLFVGSAYLTASDAEQLRNCLEVTTVIYSDVLEIKQKKQRNAQYCSFHMLLIVDGNLKLGSAYLASPMLGKGGSFELQQRDILFSKPREFLLLRCLEDSKYYRFWSVINQRVIVVCLRKEKKWNKIDTVEQRLEMIHQQLYSTSQTGPNPYRCSAKAITSSQKKIFILCDLTKKRMLVSPNTHCVLVLSKCEQKSLSFTAASNFLISFTAEPLQSCAFVPCSLKSGIMLVLLGDTYGYTLVISEDRTHKTRRFSLHTGFLKQISGSAPYFRYITKSNDQMRINAINFAVQEVPVKMTRIQKIRKQLQVPRQECIRQEESEEESERVLSKLNSQNEASKIFDDDLDDISLGRNNLKEIDDLSPPLAIPKLISFDPKAINQLQIQQGGKKETPATKVIKNNANFSFCPQAMEEVFTKISAPASYAQKMKSNMSFNPQDFMTEAIDKKSVENKKKSTEPKHLEVENINLPKVVDTEPFRKSMLKLLADCRRWRNSITEMLPAQTTQVQCIYDDIRRLHSYCEHEREMREDISVAHKLVSQPSLDIDRLTERYYQVVVENCFLPGILRSKDSKQDRLRLKLAATFRENRLRLNNCLIRFNRLPPRLSPAQEKQKHQQRHFFVKQFVDLSLLKPLYSLPN